ncbi:MAG: hypothetical protein ABW164_09635 [Sphingobium sp.]
MMAGFRVSDGRYRGLLRDVALAALIGLGGCVPEPQPDNMSTVPAPSVAVTAHIPQRLFISSHSLTNRPFPDYLEALGLAEGKRLEWSMQNIAGSSLQMRARDDISPKDGAAAYDTLILTEVHTLLESLLWNDTVGHARDYIKRFTSNNPAAHVYLYTSWLDVEDMDDPRRWIAYERAAAKAWQCTASRIDQDLAASGDGRQVQIIPAAEALAALVEQAVSERGAAFGATGSRNAMRLFFTDDVHLTDLGVYYVALISYAVLRGRFPETPWAPGIDADRARAVQDSARQFIAGWSQPRALTSAECSAYLADQFTPLYLGYVRDTQWRQEGWVRARYKWARYSIEWPALLRSDSARNPFRAGSTDP